MYEGIIRSIFYAGCALLGCLVACASIKGLEGLAGLGQGPNSNKNFKWFCFGMVWMVVCSGMKAAATGGRRSTGMTLIELAVTLAIVAILTVIAAPSMRDVLMNLRMSSQSNEVVGMFQFARSEAVRLGRPVTVSPADGSDWSQGWVVETDLDQLSTNSNLEELRTFRAFSDSTTLTNADGVVAIRFLPSGRFELDGSLYPDSTTDLPQLVMCDSRSGEIGRIIVLSYSGQPRVKKPALDSSGNVVAATDPC